jgi:hypothetical protein
MIIENNTLRKGVCTKTEEAENEKLASRCPIIWSSFQDERDGRNILITPQGTKHFGK